MRRNVLPRTARDLRRYRLICGASLILSRKIVFRAGIRKTCDLESIRKGRDHGKYQRGSIPKTSDHGKYRRYLSAKAQVTMGIADVLEHYGADMARVAATGWRPIKCPFHDDRIASASVNVEYGAFACHACGMRGDAISLIRKNEHTSYRGAIEWASKIFGESNNSVPFPTSRDKARKRHAWRNSLSD